jgi:signal transduction histidine kinase
VRTSLRAFFLLHAAALAAVAAVALIALGVPLAARHRLGVPELTALAVAVAAAVFGAAMLSLSRAVARPVDRLLGAAARLGTAGRPAPVDLPLLGDARGFALSRAAIAFDRLATAFEEEHARLDQKVTELTAANGALAEARASLLRSEKLATVGRLAAGLAHEVGNPLGAISGYVELARTRLPKDPNPDLVDALARIEVAAQRIDRTVRDLLDFARPSQVVLVPIDLGVAIDGALRLARVQPRFRNVEVACELAPGLPRVSADEHHLAQVLLNLLLNAGDAVRGAGRVRLAARLEGNSAVLLTVEDSGAGIAPEDLPRIFDPFFTTKEPGEGTGLGLAICYRIMESFGGEISARNGEGGGALFELQLRAAPAPS